MTDRRGWAESTLGHVAVERSPATNPSARKFFRSTALGATASCYPCCRDRLWTAGAGRYLLRATNSGSRLVFTSRPRSSSSSAPRIDSGLGPAAVRARGGQRRSSHPQDSSGTVRQVSARRSHMCQSMMTMAKLELLGRARGSKLAPNISRLQLTSLDMTFGVWLVACIPCSSWSGATRLRCVLKPVKESR